MNILGICYQCSWNTMQICFLLYVASILIYHIQNVPNIYRNANLNSYVFLHEGNTFLHNYLFYPSLLYSKHVKHVE